MSTQTRYKENVEGHAAILRQRERVNNQRETQVNSPRRSSCSPRALSTLIQKLKDSKKNVL